MQERHDVIQVLIASEQPLTRAGLCALLTPMPDMAILAEVSNNNALKEALDMLRPDVLLLDLSPVITGLSDVLTRVRVQQPQMRTVLLAEQDRDCYLAAAIQAGAVGLLTKSVGAQELAAALRQAARGESLLSAAQWTRLRVWEEQVTARWQRLTERERQILGWLSRGQATQSIAETLCIERCTVETHIGNILSKLEVNSRVEAVVWVWRHGIDVGVAET